MVSLVYPIVATICAFLLAYVATPAVRVLAFHIGAVDVPLDGRRIHKKPIPRIGGVAIYFGFVVTSLLFCDVSRELVTIWIGGGVLVIIGIIDDVVRLNAWIKLIVQLVVAVFAVCNGTVITHVNLGGGYVPLGVFSIPLSILWIAGLTNAINFIDGLDGLACGVSAISSLSLLIVVLLHGDMISTLLCAIMLGACLGFLPFNSNPARIFMGDTGALFLGFCFAVLSVQGVFKLHAVLAFIVPLTIFAVPLFDMVFAIVRRLVAGKSPFAPDRGHIHHRLIDMGFTQKESVKILYALCALLGLVAVFCTETMFENLRVVKSIAIAVISVALFVINLIIMKNPVTRRHSGLTEDDMTTEDYFHELDPEKARRIEMHNGGVPHEDAKQKENLTDENETAHEKAPTETEDSVR
ncbi:MAG: undecaprenyl/decaprenyl-phosphate alpha-N-acetylglucosaminyl 1-phosphate transferase [Clostridia bacterium]|nr:undecaprenyl/decaprenyl-phosphate alpha-N-acetylglucosaminyl 1-phosphate transferase [Clostridia bacterium]MBR4186555.1 undecaprenyl/decaprenyl-phosphate alpha-N-acetylglucosaminyl 1-phosphate transferase [Clostridia bacterium]